MVINCSGGIFQDSREIKNELKSRNVPGEVVRTKHSRHYWWQT